MRYACLYIYIFILLQCPGAAISPVQVTSFYIPLLFPVYKIAVLNISFIYIYNCINQCYNFCFDPQT